MRDFIHLEMETVTTTSFHRVVIVCLFAFVYSRKYASHCAQVRLYCNAYSANDIQFIYWHWMDDIRTCESVLRWQAFLFQFISLCFSFFFHCRNHCECCCCCCFGRTVIAWHSLSSNKQIKWNVRRKCMQHSNRNPQNVSHIITILIMINVSKYLRIVFDTRYTLHVHESSIWISRILFCTKVRCMHEMDSKTVNNNIMQ